MGQIKKKTDGGGGLVNEGHSARVTCPGWGGETIGQLWYMG